jgi:hypothetical protein
MLTKKTFPKLHTVRPSVSESVASACDWGSGVCAASYLLVFYYSVRSCPAFHRLSQGQVPHMEWMPSWRHVPRRRSSCPGEIRRCTPHNHNYVMIWNIFFS